jgi:Mrp family chromosome partitioning ATPase
VNFDILPAGTIPPNPGELIRSEKLIQMFVELRKRYDFIIVDTSPIGIVTDAYSLADLADANIFIVRNGKTNKTFFKKLSAHLKFDNIPNMFTIMNDNGSNEGSQYTKYNSYGYRYSYGYGYTSKKKRQEKTNVKNDVTLIIIAITSLIILDVLIYIMR